MLSGKMDEVFFVQNGPKGFKNNYCSRIKRIKRNFLDNKQFKLKDNKQFKQK